MRFFALLPSVLAVTVAGGAFAQTPATTGMGGPTVPGVCMLSREAVFANAKVGVAATARLKALADQAQAEVEVQRKPIEVDAKAFQAETAKLSPDQRAARERSLNTRLQQVQALAAQRSREIEATRAKAMQQIGGQLQPSVAGAYKQHGCGLLLDRISVLSGNYANDLTPEVVKALDAKMSTIQFDREILPATAPVRG